MNTQQIGRVGHDAGTVRNTGLSRKLVGCIIGAIVLPFFCIGVVVSFFIVRDAIVYREQIQDWVINGEGKGGQRTSTVPQTPIPAVVNALPPGNADAGARLFESRGCTGCHSLAAGQSKVGPPAQGMWARAATRKPTLSTREYLYESIVAPNAFVAPGFPATVMPGNYGTSLSSQQIADMLAYMERDLR